MNVNPWAQVLSRIQWEIFGSLTFAGALPPGPFVRSRALWSLLYHASEITGQPYGRLLTATREESGEHTGRLHLHFLLAGSRQANLMTLAFRLESFWRNKYGICKVRPVLPRAGGRVSEYLCKGMSAGHLHEMGKFGMVNPVLGCKLTVSRSCLAVIARQERISTHGASRDSVKTGLH